MGRAEPYFVLTVQILSVTNVSEGEMERVVVWLADGYGGYEGVVIRNEITHADVGPIQAQD